MNHGTAKSGSRQAALNWFPLLQRLHQLQNPRPRQRTTVQQFMLDHPDLVNAKFTSLHADGGSLRGSAKMNLKYEVAKHMLTDHYSHLTRTLDEKAVAQQELDLVAWNLILTDISEAPDVSRYVLPLFRVLSTHTCVHSVRDNLFDAVHPLLEAIGMYAGCYVTLIAGNPERDDTDKGFFTA